MKDKLVDNYRLNEDPQSPVGSMLISYVHKSKCYNSVAHQCLCGK
jgi:hypothetical protein